MILYAISDRAAGAPGDLIDQATRLLRSGVDWLQIREKDLPDRALFEILQVLAPEARRWGASLLVNGRPDLALASGASGAHLPASAPPTARIRASFPRPFLLVRSCHSHAEVLEAQSGGADAATLGPVFATPSKAAWGEPVGLDRLRGCVARARIPVLALGGVGPGEIGDVIRCGAAGIAAIRLFWGMKNPSEEVPSLKARIAGLVSP